MPHGTPDWGITAAKSTIYSLHDMGELAVRLGSMVTFDRRGDVIFSDTFDRGPTGITAIGAGAGNEIYTSNVVPLHGSLHLYFKTGPTAGDHSGFVNVFPLPVLGGIGVECSFVPVANLMEFKIDLFIFDGAIEWKYYIRYVHQTGLIEIFDRTAGWVTIGSPGKQRTDYTFYTTLKFVIDTLNRRYVRAILNSHTYLGGDREINFAIDDTVESMAIQVYAMTNVNAAIEVAVDRFIITQNEPTS